MNRPLTTAKYPHTEVSTSACRTGRLARRDRRTARADAKAQDGCTRQRPPRPIAGGHPSSTTHTSETSDAASAGHLRSSKVGIIARFRHHIDAARTAVVVGCVTSCRRRRADPLLTCAVVARCKAVNFLMADMQAGIGPFLGVWLLAHGWESGWIGSVMTLGGVAGVLMTTPAGAWVDASRHKRWLVASYRVSARCSLPRLSFSRSCFGRLLSPRIRQADRHQPGL